jgi:SAM-dependent methyltransferase
VTITPDRRLWDVPDTHTIGGDMFFNDHPEFLETSSTANFKVRLNWRHRAMIASNAELLAGARVLDIASHNGRWSMAALEAGAKEVIGIEGRPELVERAEGHFKQNRVPEDRYRFIAGDVFDVLADPDTHDLGRFDVVMCVGFLYHTLRYPELFSGIRRLKPRHLIIDTQVHNDKSMTIFLAVDRVEIEGQAIDSPLGHNGLMLAGRPTPRALKTMLDVYDFDVVSKFPWEELIASRRRLRRKKAMEGYVDGNRLTWVAANRNLTGNTPREPAVIRRRERKKQRRSGEE